jgi:hypothetical protein
MQRVQAVGAGFLVVVAVGCESDEKKAMRLNSEQVTACLTAQRLSEAFGAVTQTAEYDLSRNLMTEWSAYYKTDTTRANLAMRRADSIERAIGVDTLAEQATKAKARCDVATRDYNRFMR